MTTTISENFETRIINEIMLAQQSIKIAVAWFNSNNILNILCWKLKGGIGVEIILHHDDINSGGESSLDFTEYLQIGGRLVWAKGEQSTMHAKFCIIDDRVLLHGSCNWTYRAFNKNDEVLNVTNGESELIKSYISTFLSLREKYTTNTKTFLEKKATIDNKVSTDCNPLHFILPSTVNSQDELQKGMYYFLRKQPQWLSGYETIAEWLADNKSRGLLCVGTSGLGKTLICQKVLPMLLKRYFDIEVMSVTAMEMCSRIDELYKYCHPGRIIIIDGLGTEPEVWFEYGNRRHPFKEIADIAEQRNTLLIITTNLSTAPVSKKFRNIYPMSIEERYGNSTLSHLRATTRVALFKGQDMRWL
jgi:DNA replication protein DnaC